MQKAIDYLVFQAMRKIDKYESYAEELEALEQIYLFSMHVEVEKAIEDLKDYEEIHKESVRYMMHRFTVKTGKFGRFIRFIARVLP